MRSVKETFQKIEVDISRKPFISIVVTFIILIIFLIIKIIQINNLDNLASLDFIDSKYSFQTTESNISKYIYASSRGSKYYFFDCKSNIKEANKIFFATEEEAKQAGYTQAKTCK